MSQELKVAPELQARVDDLIARTGMTADQIVSDALENGHSLEWQERFVEKVEAGVAAADRGDFASATELERVRSKYCPS